MILNMMQKEGMINVTAVSRENTRICYDCKLVEHIDCCGNLPLKCSSYRFIFHASHLCGKFFVYQSICNDDIREAIK